MANGWKKPREREQKLQPLMVHRVPLWLNIKIIYSENVSDTINGITLTIIIFPHTDYRVNHGRTKIV